MYMESAMTNTMLPQIEIEVCYQEFEVLVLRKMKIDADTSVAALISRLTSAKDAPAVMSSIGFGIAVFGKKKDTSYILCEGDRLEFCRPLKIHPMDIRRKRARREHKSGKM